MANSYQAYGIAIHSTCRIPALESAPTGGALFSLRFETGARPEWVKNAEALPGRVRTHLPGIDETADPAFVLTEHGGDRYCTLAYSDGARFVLDDAAGCVWGAVEPPLSEADLASYFLGPVLGFILRHRHVTCLHASAVELHDHAVLFSGSAGFGKSTTAAALGLRGATVLSDDIVPIQFTRERYWAIPGYPRICLWPESVASLIGPDQDLQPLSLRWEKRYLPVDGVRAKFAEDKKPLGMIYLFGERSADVSAPRVEELNAREALLGLVQNTYMNWLLNREQRALEFDELSKIVQQIPVRRLVAHSDGAKLGLLCERIFEDAESMLARS